MDKQRKGEEIKMELTEKESMKGIVFGPTGYGKSYTYVKPVIEQSKKLLFITSNGIKNEFRYMGFYEDMSLPSGADAAGIEKDILLPFDAKNPSSKMYIDYRMPYALREDMESEDIIRQIEESGITDDEEMIIIMINLFYLLNDSHAVDRITRWNCRVMVEYTCTKNDIQSGELTYLLSKSEWKALPVFEPLYKRGEDKNDATIDGLYPDRSIHSELRLSKNYSIEQDTRFTSIASILIIGAVGTGTHDLIDVNLRAGNANYIVLTARESLYADAYKELDSKGYAVNRAVIGKAPKDMLDDVFGKEKQLLSLCLDTDDENKEQDAGIYIKELLETYNLIRLKNPGTHIQVYMEDNICDYIPDIPAILRIARRMNVGICFITSHIRKEDWQKYMSVANFCRAVVYLGSKDGDTNEWVRYVCDPEQVLKTQKTYDYDKALLFLDNKAVQDAKILTESYITSHSNSADVSKDESCLDGLKKYEVEEYGQENTNR